MSTKRGPGTQMILPESPSLSKSQLAILAELGEERRANAGDVLYRAGDRCYPFIAILEGQVAIVDAAGNELVRHGASDFLGDMVPVSEQIGLVTAVVTETVRYIAAAQEVMRSLLYEDESLSDLILSAFMLRREAHGRSSSPKPSSPPSPPQRSNTIVRNHDRLRVSEL